MSAALEPPSSSSLRSQDSLRSSCRRGRAADESVVPLYNQPDFLKKTQRAPTKTAMIARENG